MKTSRCSRYLCLALAGGTVLQTTSCTSELADALVSAVSTSVISVVEEQLTDYIDQIFENADAT